MTSDAAGTESSLRVDLLAAQLADAVGIAQRAVVANPPLVAHTGILLWANRGRLLVVGSDGETTIAARVPAPGSQPGTVLVHPRPLAAWLSTHPKTARVELRGDGADLCATADGGRTYRFRGLSATFGDPGISRAGMVDLRCEGLGEALAGVRHASDGVVRLRSGPAGLWVEATDYHRAAGALLAGVHLDGLCAVANIGPVIEMARREVTSLGVDPRGRELRGASEQVWVSTRLVATPFPEVDQLIAAAPARTVTVGVAGLSESLTRVDSVANGAPATLTIGGSTMTVEAANGEVGSGGETIPVEGDGGGFTCGVSVRYLREAVGAHLSGSVRLHWSGPEQPLYVSGATPWGEMWTVVMPVRL